MPNGEIPQQGAPKPLPVRIIPDDGEPFLRFAESTARPAKEQGEPRVFRIPDDSPKPPKPPRSEDSDESDDPDEERPDIEAEGEAYPEEPTEPESDPVDAFTRRLMQQAGAEREKLLEAARAESMQIRAIARKEGYEQAYAEKRAELEDCLTRVDRMLELLDSRQQEFLLSYEKGLRELAGDIAEKVLRQQLGESEHMLLALVNQAVSAFKSEDWISVEVSEQMPKLVELLKKAADAARDGVYIEINPVDAPPDHCVVSAPQGVIDATASVQMENIRELLARID